MIQKAKEILLEDDEYVKGLSVFDLQSKMNTDLNVTKEEFKQYQAAAVIPWEDDDILNWEPLIAAVKIEIETLNNIPLPNAIYLNLTTGAEEAGAAYTRGKQGIFLPRNMIHWSNNNSSTKKLLLHETWHVISRNLRSDNPQLRNNIYSIIGFKSMGHEMGFPAELTKISNPDAPLLEHYCTVTLEDGSIMNVLPIIHSKVKNFDPKAGLSFFRLMLRQMLLVKQIENTTTWEPDRINDKLQLKEIDSMPENFWQQVGRNTSYLIHPEETIADNFSFIFTDDKYYLPNPEILQKFKTYLEIQD